MLITRLQNGPRLAKVALGNPPAPVSEIHPVVIFGLDAEQFTWVDVHVLTVRLRVVAQPRQYDVSVR